MTKITAFFTAIMTWLTMIFNPAVPVEGIFTETETKEQVILDCSNLYGQYKKDLYGRLN